MKLKKKIQYTKKTTQYTKKDTKIQDVMMRTQAVVHVRDYFVIYKTILYIGPLHTIPDRFFQVKPGGEGL